MCAEQTKTPIRVLIVEDSDFDARVILATLKQSGYAPDFTRVETPEALLNALGVGSWNLVISDYNLPDFNALDALRIVHQSGQDLPFIIVSGGIGEATAVDAMKAGAHDYIMKGNQARLGPAVRRELREAEERRARLIAEASSRESELRYRLLWETAADAVLLVSRTGIIEFANPAARILFQIPLETLQGNPVSFLQPQSLLQSGCLDLMSHLLSSQLPGDRRTVETRVRRLDGTEIPIEVSAGTMSLHQKCWLVAFIRDISQRKEAEKTLQENAEQFRAAREIQERLFPKNPPSIPGFDIAGRSIPAAAAGGDYYDFIPMLNGRIGVVVADVSGHGVGPALLMAETRAYLRILARNRENIGEIFTRANMMLAEDLSPEQFITLLLVCIDPARKTLIHANAGHPSGCLIGQDGNLRAQLKRTGVPLGMHPKTTYTPATEVQLLPGDTLMIFTDGVEESSNPAGEFFERERVIEFVKTHRHKTARQIVDTLYSEVRSFSGTEPQHDDFTVIVVKVAPDLTNPSTPPSHSP